MDKIEELQEEISVLQTALVDIYYQIKSKTKELILAELKIKMQRNSNAYKKTKV